MAATLPSCSSKTWRSGLSTALLARSPHTRRHGLGWCCAINAESEKKLYYLQPFTLLETNISNHEDFDAHLTNVVMDLVQKMVTRETEGLSKEERRSMRAYLYGILADILKNQARAERVEDIQDSSDGPQWSTEPIVKSSGSSEEKKTKRLADLTRLANISEQIFVLLEQMHQQVKKTVPPDKVDKKQVTQCAKEIRDRLARQKLLDFKTEKVVGRMQKYYTLGYMARCIVEQCEKPDGLYSQRAIRHYVKGLQVQIQRLIGKST
jgi:hypothetical protein